MRESRKTVRGGGHGRYADILLTHQLGLFYPEENPFSEINQLQFEIIKRYSMGQPEQQIQSDLNLLSSNERRVNYNLAMASSALRKYAQSLPEGCTDTRRWFSVLLNNAWHWEQQENARYRQLS